MSIFIDTSAFLAVIDSRDGFHMETAEIWKKLIGSSETLNCSDYIVVEVTALTQSRMGMDAVRTLETDLLPIVEIIWVDETLHQAGMSAFLSANRRQLSLVDCVSFEIMRKFGMHQVFSFDKHFSEQNFDLIA